MVGNVLSLVVLTVVAGSISAMLVRHAQQIGLTTAALLAEREAVAERARYDERSRQYRLLHDSVLCTLNSIASGAEYGPRLRERCAADAELIRGMISADPRVSGVLAAELALVVHAQFALGLRVHQHFGDLPDHLPPAVVAALAGACREALNNVLKHAGTGEAWVTATAGPDGTLTVTVVDRGPGLPRPFTPGLGLRRSVAARMAEAGGSSSLDSEPGQGTRVELTWPR
jgi:signal transduction histidine kinase